jgi:ABC-type dipeptide/oligopeptide/nickel transport system permease subunit
VFAPVIAPYSPTKVNLNAQFEPPSRQHLFGTDVYGRDQLSRIVHAARVDLLVALSATAIALTLGSTLAWSPGTVAAGWTSSSCVRSTP